MRKGIVKEVFVPVSSIIHTIDYEDNRRRFHLQTMTALMDSSYLVDDNGLRFPRIYGYGGIHSNDQTSSWNLKNTFASGRCGKVSKIGLSSG